MDGCPTQSKSLHRKKSFDFLFCCFKMKPGSKSRMYRPLMDETMPSVATMSTRIAEDKLAFRELQRQLKTRGATTSAGIKQTLHDDLVIQFNEMNERGDEDRSIQVQSMPDGQKWSEVFSRRLSLSSLRATVSQRSLNCSTRGLTSKRSFNLATARGLSSQRTLNLQLSRGVASQRSLFDRPERNAVPAFANDANIYTDLLPDMRTFERRGR